MKNLKNGFKDYLKRFGRLIIGEIETRKLEIEKKDYSYEEHAYSGGGWGAGMAFSKTMHVYSAKDMGTGEKINFHTPDEIKEGSRIKGVFTKGGIFSIDGLLEEYEPLET